MRNLPNDPLAADIADRGAGVAARHDPERKCILTGIHGPRDALIRLALDDAGTVHADLGARAPGRGAWLSPDQRLIATAADKGKLRGALIRAFKTTSVKVPDDLVATIASGLERRALDRLGLENKAGNLIWGSDRIGEALTGGRAKLVLHAADAAADGVAKLDGKARATGAAVLVLPVGRDQLSVALGRDNVVHAAVCDSGAAARVTAAVGRWRAFNGLISDGPAAIDAGDQVSG